MNDTIKSYDGKETFRCLIPAEQLKERIAQLAADIKRDHEGETPLFLCVLTGAFMFASDLVRAYDGPCQVVFIRLSSYTGTESSGDVQQVMGLSEDIAGRSVVIVEDIVESGLTMSRLIGMIQNKGAKSVKLATLVRKPKTPKYPVTIDYNGFDIEDKYVIGYGFDIDGIYRNLPAVYCKE